MSAVIEHITEEIQAGRILKKEYQNGHDILSSNPKLYFKVIDSTESMFATIGQIMQLIEQAAYAQYQLSRDRALPMAT